MANPERTGRLVAEKVVPIVEETAVVYKERVTTDTVRLHKRVHEDEQILDIPVQTEAIEEVRVTRRQTTHNVRQQIGLRREEIVVEREAAPRDPNRDPNA